MIKHKIIQKDGVTIEKELTPLIAIREKCKECCNWSKSEVKNCQAKDCSLWPFRMGKSGNKRKK